MAETSLPRLTIDRIRVNTIQSLSQNLGPFHFFIALIYEALLNDHLKNLGEFVLSSQNGEILENIDAWSQGKYTKGVAHDRENRFFGSHAVSYQKKL